ncbi:hypothetical protein J007_04502 [Cryptococcus neoformans]|nr:hypothetical protein J007_04502 [Cryptococcus neoformans var. grubii]OXC59937.1 hypothetical protein C358_04616 [Cryptococcus neoformans var. grubii MW-RSA852]
MSAFSIVINMMGVFLPRPEPTVSECLLQLEPQQRRPIVYGPYSRRIRERVNNEKSQVIRFACLNK